jgi:hypothetical protein
MGRQKINSRKFLSPHPGLDGLGVFPTAVVVGYYRALLRSFKWTQLQTEFS